MPRANDVATATGTPVMLVTGASSGLGRAAVVELARGGGVTLLLVARREDPLEETIRIARATAGHDATFAAYPCDLADPVALEQLTARVGAEHPRLAALVNNAGVGSSSDFESPDAVDDADRMITLNLRAPIALTHALLPQLVAGGGVVVNVSSVAGLVGTPGSPVYSATKWGLTGFSEALRARVAPLGVGVVCVQPGPVPTPGWPHAALVRRPVAGRLFAATPDSVARAIARAARGRGPVAPVRPRAYAVLPFLRGMAPWAVRGLLARAGRTRAGRELTDGTTTETPA